MWRPRRAWEIYGGWDMKQVLGIIILTSLLFSCSTTYTAYRQDMLDGTNSFRHGEYEQARTYFMKALEEQRDARSLAFVATANYKLNDFAAAERYLTEAEKLKQTGFSDLRILGYKALTLLKGNRKAGGMEALKEYTDSYSHVYPMPSIDQIEQMWRKDAVDMAQLESLIDEQVTTYEFEIDLYIATGVGWYSRFPPGFF